LQTQKEVQPDKISEFMNQRIDKALTYRWYIFWIFSIQYFILYFHRVCPAVLAPELINAFNISGTSLGILSSAYFYPYAFMQVPMGMFADYQGSRKTATLFSFIAASGAILLGLSLSFNFAIFSRILIGLGASAIFVPAMKTFGAWFRGQEYARVSGLFMAVGTIGWFMGTAPLAILTQMFSWREIFIVVGVITIVLTVLTWIIVRDRPDEKGFPVIVEQKVSSTEKKGGGLRLVVSERNFWFIALWFFLRVGILFGFFGLWAGPYLTDTYGLTKFYVGNILSMAPLAIVIGSPIFGYISDKVVRSRKKILVGSSIIHSICWLVLLLFYDSLSVAVLFILFFFMGMMAGAPASVGFSMIKELFAVNVVGTSIGAANLSGFVGGVVFQPFIGYILDSVGRVQGMYPPSAYKFAFQVFFGASLIALVSVLFSKETMNRDC